MRRDRRGGNFPTSASTPRVPPLPPVYAGSGNTAVSGDMDTTSLNNDQDVMLGQVVVLFPSAKEANDFFGTSAQRWPACADRRNRRAGHARTARRRHTRSARSPTPTES